MSDQAFAFDPQWLQDTAKLPQADTRPAPSFGETAAAGFRSTYDATSTAQESRLREAYKPVLDALAERTGRKPGDFLKPWYERMAVPFTDNLEIDRDAVWKAIDAQRAADPKAFADLGERDAFEKDVLTRQGGRAKDLETAARGGFIPRLLGGIPASFADPVNLATLPIGGGGVKTVAGAVLREALTNAAVEGVQAATENRQLYKNLGEDYGVKEGLEDVGMAALFGGVVGGGIHALPKLDAFGRDALAPVRAAIDTHFADQDAARAVAQMVPEHVRTPEQQAALQILSRAEEIDKASPFTPTYGNLDEHARRLSEAMDQIEAGRITPDRPIASLHEGGPDKPSGVANDVSELSPRPASETRSAAPGRALAGITGTIATMLERGGLPQHQARGVAAGLFAESGGRVGAVNPTSGAFGISQWLGPRKAELLRRYGPNPSLAEQVEFVLHELRGGDKGGARVLAQGDEASALRSFVEDFLRPAKGGETEGDLSRGMAALGRHGEEAPEGGGAGVAVDDGADVRAALGEEAAAVDAQRAGLDEPAVAPIEAPTVPELDRKLFDNDTEWRIAQAEHVARETGGDPAEDLLYRVRQVVADRDRAASLNQTKKLAAELGTSPQVLKESLEQLAGLGEIRQVGDRFGRLQRAAASGPADLVRFLAQKGGLEPNGLGAKEIERIERDGGKIKGHDLRNTGHLNHFVPGAGPLLRKTGMGLDRAAELAHDAGYFGPPSVTPRPDEGQFITLLNDAIREKRKIYSSYEGLGAGPDAPFRGDDPERAALVDRFRAEIASFDPELADVLDTDFAHIAGDAALLWSGASGRLMDPIAAIEQAARQAYHDVGERAADELGDIFDADFRPAQGWKKLTDAEVDALFGLGQDGAQRGDPGGRQAADAGDAGAGAGDAQGAGEARRPLTGAEADAADELGLRGDEAPDPKAAKAFDSDAGDGIRAAAESDWHDIRAEIQQSDGFGTLGREDYKRRFGQLWLKTPDELDQLFDDAKLSEAAQLHRAVDLIGLQPSEGLAGLLDGEHFNWDKVAARIEKEAEAAGKLIPDEADALLNPKWDDPPVNNLPMSEDVEELRRAIAAGSDDDIGMLANEIGWSLRKLDETKIREVLDGSGIVEDQARMLTVRLATERLGELGMSAAEVPQAVFDGMVRNGVSKETADELTQSIFEALQRGAGGGEPPVKAALAPPALPAPEKFDLDDGKGPRTAAEIDAEISSDKAALEAIRQCLT